MIKIYAILKIYLIALFIILLSLISLRLFAQEVRQLTIDKPEAIADLKTIEGAALVNASWMVQPAHLKQVNFKAPGVIKNGGPLALYPTGETISTNTLHPQITDADFDAGFKSIAPTELERREGTGLVSFVWYKTELTIPEKIGRLNTNGSTAVFEITIDDYSEIWVNGKQQQAFGQAGNGLIAGYNSRNRVILTSNAKTRRSFFYCYSGY